MTRKISNPQRKSLTSYSQIAIVTGAGAGIGLQTALLLAEKGIRVYALTRTPASLATLDEKVTSQGLNHFISTICLDVTIQNQREDIKNIVLDRESEHLYSEKPAELILINNAGIGSMGSAEETPPQELQRVIDTNFYGAIEMTRLFLPVMRQNRQGKIIQVSSGYGRVGAPLMSAYCASKFALEGYSESLRYELLPFNLFVTLVEPGPVLTNFRDKMSEEPNKTDSPYRDIQLAFDKILEKGKKWSSSPEGVANVIYRICRSAKPRLRYEVGPIGRLAKITSSYVPAKIQENYYRIPKTKGVQKNRF